MVARLGVRRQRQSRLETAFGVGGDGPGRQRGLTVHQDDALARVETAAGGHDRAARQDGLAAIAGREAYLAFDQALGSGEQALGRGDGGNCDGGRR
ncbi:hypothetical protein D3C85_1443700 [compost metagenome]